MPTLTPHHHITSVPTTAEERAPAVDLHAESAGRTSIVVGVAAAALAVAIPMAWLPALILAVTGVEIGRHGELHARAHGARATLARVGVAVGLLAVVASVVALMIVGNFFTEVYREVGNPRS